MARKGLSPKVVRESHVARSGALPENGSLFPQCTLPKYKAMSIAQQKKFRDAVRATLKCLDEEAAEEAATAQRRLFSSPPEGSSSQAAAVTTPKKKKKMMMNAEPDGWSPDCDLSPGNPKRDGHRPALRMHVDFTPDGKKKAKLVD